MKVIEGNIAAPEARVAIVVARFNSFINENLVDGALDVLKRQGLVGVTRTRVPILSIGHRRDFICPESDIRTLASSSHYGKAIVLDKLPVMEVFAHALSETCDWLKLHFNI